LDKSNLKRLAQIKCILSVDGIGPSKLFQLIAKYSSLENVFKSDLSDFVNFAKLNQSLAKGIFSSLQNLNKYLDAIHLEVELLQKFNAKMYSFYDEDYPQILKSIYSPPIILYQIGELKAQDKNSIAVVGTRLPTNYGKIQTEKFVKELLKSDLTITSGLARGIDSVAHSTVIKNGGRTIAVIGSGLDVIYPPENRRLFNTIAEKGVIISEYPLGTKPDAINFPKRNRIISGLSLGTLVIESKISGGALLTAKYAFDQNREVFAIPGNLGIKQSEGPNYLISRNSAKLVQNTDDILEELNMIINPVFNKILKEVPKDLSLFEQNIYDNLDTEPIHIDKLAEASLSI